MDSNIKIRLVGPEDYQAVVDTHGNVFNGTDYLPALYHTFLQDPDMKMFVAEYEGKLVKDGPGGGGAGIFPHDKLFFFSFCTTGYFLKVNCNKFFQFFEKNNTLKSEKCK